MSELNNQKYLLTSQYNNAQKLKARIELHQRFSTNTYNWHRWVFDHFTLPAQSTLLELGCGPADLWCKNADRIPEQWQITLSDFSPGMLQEAQRNLQHVPHSFTLRHIDAQAIPFANASFDAVIANHMLYHVPDRALALAEIARVLKPGGVLYAATNGRNNMHELTALATSIDLRIVTLWGDTLKDSFYLESGHELAPWFFPITIHRYDDALEITEAEPLLAYILSTSVASLFDEALLQKAITLLRNEIAQKGSIHISKDGGMFEARRAKG